MYNTYLSFKETPNKKNLIYKGKHEGLTILLVKKSKIHKDFIEYLEEKVMNRLSYANPVKMASPIADKEPNKKPFGKKLYILGAVAISIVILSAFLFSNSSTAVVPLSLNYEVGERMVYAGSWSTVTQRYNQTNNMSSTYSTDNNSTLIIDVISLDDETYTINNTYNLDILGRPLTTNLTQQLTKSDYVNNFLIGDAARLLYNMTGEKIDYYKLNLLQAKVGDTLQIPINTGNESIGTIGTLTLKFAAIEDITVAAGTFKVFRLDYSADFTIHANIHGIINIQLPEPIPGQITGQTYLEYGTCRLIKSNVQETNQFPEPSGYNYTYTSQRTLTQLIKP